MKEESNAEDSVSSPQQRGELPITSYRKGLAKGAENGKEKDRLGLSI